MLTLSSNCFLVSSAQTWGHSPNLVASLSNFRAVIVGDTPLGFLLPHLLFVGFEFVFIVVGLIFLLHISVKLLWKQHLSVSFLQLLVVATFFSGSTNKIIFFIFLWSYLFDSFNTKSSPIKECQTQPNITYVGVDMHLNHPITETQCQQYPCCY